MGTHYYLDRGVTCRASDTAVLFRIGETILPIGGASIRSWYKTAAGMLEAGERRCDHLFSSMKDRSDQVNEIISSLLNAGMVHTEVPGGEQTNMDKPLTLLGPEHYMSEGGPMPESNGVFELLGKNIKLLTTTSLAPHFVSALNLAGICDTKIEAIATEKDHCIISSFRGTGLTLNQSDRVSRIEDNNDYSKSEPAIPDIDHLIIAAPRGPSWQFLCSQADAMKHMGCRTMVGTCIGGNIVISGVIDLAQAGSCTYCLEQMCSTAWDQQMEQITSKESPAIAGIIASMTIETLWRAIVVARITPRVRQVLQLDTVSGHLGWRPKNLGLECPRCASVDRLKSLPWQYENHTEAYEHDNRELMKLATRFYMHPDRGVIKRFCDGALLQYPGHQSAAIIAKSAPNQDFLVRETGEDIDAARLATILVALEVHCDGLLKQKQISRPFGVANTAKQCATSGSLLCEVVVASYSKKRLLGESFYRCVAKAVSKMPGWTVIPIPMAHSSARTSLLARYLGESELLANLVVESCTIVNQQIRLLRVCIEGNVLSIAIGGLEDDLFGLALNDIWLQQQALPALSQAHAPRFRVSPTAALRDDIDIVIQQTEEQLNLSFAISRLEDSGQLSACPVYLAHAQLTTANMNA
jgi:hypothetical protein